MQVIGCQLDIAWEDKPANFARTRELLAGQTIVPGSLVVLPEMFATGFSMHVDTIAESIDGPTHQFMAQLARDTKSFVLGGVVTKAADGRGRNQAVTFTPAGQEIARYTKAHPFSFAGEDQHYEPGGPASCFAWHDLQVAPTVCYDLRFPELYRHATRSGAQVLVVIANWPQSRESHWLALLRARAIENQAYVVGVNRAGCDPHVAYGGHSLIASPRGETLAEAGAEAQTLVADLESGPLETYRREFPALADIRPELLGRGEAS
jgi:predicted amidohydrolase